MHRGVQEFIEWIRKNSGFSRLSLNPGATTAAFSQIETLIGAPLPQDLRFVLSHYNGGSLPSGQLMGIGGRDPNAIEAVLAILAERAAKPISDPDLLLPFFRTDEGSVLAFDRSAAPISDTWPIVDYSSESGVSRLVFRTFDGWCRFCVADWNAQDFREPFTLEKYLNRGLRHVAIEPDVSIAHATVAHALRRLGKPEKALQSYLRAGRCVPSQPWCDWEALKLAALLGNHRKAIEAATRLCARAPEKRWGERETTPAIVADVLGIIADQGPNRVNVQASDKSAANSPIKPSAPEGPARTVLSVPDEPARGRKPVLMDDLAVVVTLHRYSPERLLNRELLLRFFDQLSEQCGTQGERARVNSIRKAVFSGEPLPATLPINPTAVPKVQNKEQWWEALKQAYRSGEVRDDDLLLDPVYRELGSEHDFAEILSIYRSF
ncbi:MAG: SMI1/KNR4 family protein [Deltaproteobacteria bacterium]|nr:SMI1/KNR4 family protein [Deltaproteobacteria bacterium]